MQTGLEGREGDSPWWGNGREKNFVRILSRTNRDYIPALLKKWECTANRFAKTKILYTIAARGNAEYTEKLLQIVDAEKPGIVRLEGYWALGKLGDTRALDFLRNAALKDEHPLDRYAAAEAASWISGKAEAYVDRDGALSQLTGRKAMIERVHSLQNSRTLWINEGKPSKYRCPVLGDVLQYPPGGGTGASK